MPSTPDSPFLPADASDEAIMRIAIDAASESAAKGEVPVGAVLLRRSDRAGIEPLACAHNQPISRRDPTAHAEVLALREAAQKLGNYRLDDCELYVTLEPCAMCAQALLHARVRRVVYGAREPKTGAAGSVLDLFALPQLNHHTEVTGGVLADECAALMQDFFAGRREQTKRAAVALRDDALRAPASRFEAVWRAWPGLRDRSGFEQAIAPLRSLRLHFVDAGPAEAPRAWLALHGPDAYWPQLAGWASRRVEAGERALLPDLIGFGQSDKPKKSSWHSLAGHAEILLAWLDSRNVGTFRIAHAPGQAALAQRLGEIAPARVIEVLALAAAELETLPTEWLDAPYPDAGHRAGPRAWTEQGWAPSARLRRDARR